MIILIAGASHTGKTALAQLLLEQYGYPYLSLDHLKMGLIRSGNTTLTPTDADSDLTEYLWPIAREIIKTAFENRQNLIVEGCYIPHTWRQDFSSDCLMQMRYVCLVMSRSYLLRHADLIRAHAHDIEFRGADADFSPSDAVAENEQNLSQCRRSGNPVLLIDSEYPSAGQLLAFMKQEIGF